MADEIDDKGAAAAASAETPPAGSEAAPGAAAGATPSTPAAAPEPTLEQAVDASIAAAAGKKSSEPAVAPAAGSEPGKAPAGKAPVDGDGKGGQAAKGADGNGEKDNLPGEQNKPEGQKPDAGAAQELDHVNDPIPAQVSERTRERMTFLVDRVKQQDRAISQADELMSAITRTGVSPDDFAVTLEVLRLSHSGSVDDKRKAYRELLRQTTELATVLGEPVPGKDPLEGHADLQADLAASKITQERAYELAIQRNRSVATQRVNQTTQAQQQQYTQARETARGELNALGQRLAASDPHYAAKAPAVFEAIKPELATLHPSQWRARFLEEYVATPVPAAVVPAGGAAPAGGAKPAGNQPLRPNKQPAGGGGAKAPSSPLEALEAGLEALSSVRR